MRRYFVFGLGETYRSVFLRAQLKAIRAYMPGIDRADLRRGPTGVRAQALDEMGNLVDDFVFDVPRAPNSRLLHVRNAPSPGATSSLAIAKMIVDKAREQFRLH